MANEKNNEYAVEEIKQGEKKNLNVEIDAKNYAKLKDYSRTSDKSVSAIVNDAVRNEICHAKVKQILPAACDSEELPKDSKVCKAIAEGHHHY